MSTNRSRMAIIGPIIGFILIYVIIRYAVGEFQTDLNFLGHMGAVTIHEVQHMAGGEAEVQEAETEEKVATEAEDEDEAAGEEATKTQAEEPAAEGPAAEEDSNSHD